MEDPQYSLQCSDSSHSDQLQLAIESLNNGETDLSIITEDGQKIETQKSLICLYSKTVARYLSDIPCCNTASISLPVSSLAINNLLNVIINGFVKTVAIEELSDVTDTAKILGIDLQNIDFGLDNDDTNLDEDYNVVIKTEPEMSKSRGRKKKLENNKTKDKRRKRIIKIKEEPDAGEVNVDHLLQEDVRGNEEDNLKCNNWEEVATENHSCTQCGKVFTTKFAKQVLYSHMRSHMGKKPFPCDQCGKQFSTKVIMRRHKKTHDGKDYILVNNDGKYKCKHCDTTAETKMELQKHVKSVHTENFVNWYVKTQGRTRHTYG